MTMKSSPVELRKVTKIFGQKTVIPPALDLAIPAGSYCTFLGPSGCGKTTLLRMIAGLDEPTEGEVLIGGRVVSRAVPPEDRRLGMVFQSYAVWPHMTVSQNIAFPLECKRDPGATASSIADRVAEAIALVELRGLEERRPHELSGGQQQRVALARAIVCNPAVLLLDEPLSNLDARLRAGMRKELAALHRKRGMTVVHVTHDKQEAFELSDLIVVMDAGRIAMSGTPSEIRGPGAPEFVREFLREG